MSFFCLNHLNKEILKHACWALFLYMWPPSPEKSHQNMLKTPFYSEYWLTDTLHWGGWATMYFINVCQHFCFRQIKLLQRKRSSNTADSGVLHFPSRVVMTSWFYVKKQNLSLTTRHQDSNLSSSSYQGHAVHFISFLTDFEEFFSHSEFRLAAVAQHPRTPRVSDNTANFKPVDWR